MVATGWGICFADMLFCFSFDMALSLRIQADSNVRVVFCLLPGLGSASERRRQRKAAMYTVWLRNFGWLFVRVPINGRRV